MTVGNIDSTEKGSGARYNDGKPDYSLLVLKDFSKWLGLAAPECYIVDLINKLGNFQETHDPEHLLEALEVAGKFAIEESTHVFTYGAKKYKAFNWMKGMKWSIPLACAVRHSLAIYDGEEVDEESGRKHVGHIVCNIMMLLHYTKYYKEGNDLPPVECFQ